MSGSGEDGAVVIIKQLGRCRRHDRLLCGRHRVGNSTGADTPAISHTTSTRVGAATAGQASFEPAGHHHGLVGTLARSALH